jgi:hypothetical protein
MRGHVRGHVLLGGWVLGASMLLPPLLCFPSLPFPSFGSLRLFRVSGVSLVGHVGWGGQGRDDRLLLLDLLLGGHGRDDGSQVGSTQVRGTQERGIEGREEGGREPEKVRPWPERTTRRGPERRPEGGAHGPGQGGPQGDPEREGIRPKLVEGEEGHPGGRGSEGPGVGEGAEEGRPADHRWSSPSLLPRAGSCSLLLRFLDLGLLLLPPLLLLLEPLVVLVELVLSFLLVPGLPLPLPLPFPFPLSLSPLSLPSLPLLVPSLLPMLLTLALREDGGGMLSGVARGMRGMRGTGLGVAAPVAAPVAGLGASRVF